MKYNEFKELVTAAAKARGLEAYELYCTESEEVAAEVLYHEISSFSTAAHTGASFRCIHEGKIGSAATELFTAQEAERIVEAAMENAYFTENTESAFIHASGDTYENPDPVITPQPSAAQLEELALAIQEKAYGCDSRVADGSLSEAAFLRSSVSLSNSRGLDLTRSRAYCLAACNPSVKEAGELYDSIEIKAAAFQDLNPQDIASKAVKEAVSTIGADTVESSRYHLVFSGKMTATLLSTFFSAFSGVDAQRGLSLWGGKEGETVAAPMVTITDNPFLEGSMIQVPFDSEGVATRCKNVIENGRLVTLLHNLTTAAKAGISSTGNGSRPGYASAVTVAPYNFYMEKGGAGSREDILREAGSGIYITQFNGLHAGANPITGDFSLSSAGFLVENGELTRPVKNFTISGNFYELLKSISLVGDDLVFQTPKGDSCFGAPTILVKDMPVAGK